MAPVSSSLSASVGAGLVSAGWGARSRGSAAGCCGLSVGPARATRMARRSDGVASRIGFGSRQVSVLGRTLGSCDGWSTSGDGSPASVMITGGLLGGSGGRPSGCLGCGSFADPCLGTLSATWSEDHLVRTDSAVRRAEVTDRDVDRAASRPLSTSFWRMRLMSSFGRSTFQVLAVGVSSGKINSICPLSSTSSSSSGIEIASACSLVAVSEWVSDAAGSGIVGPNAASVTAESGGRNRSGSATCGRMADGTCWTTTPRRRVTRRRPMDASAARANSSRPGRGFPRHARVRPG